MSHATTMAGGPLPAAFESARVSSRPAAGPTATHAEAIENPLWLIVIGMACFFSVAALAVAWC
ncbi:MAG: hypothetical protein WB646_13545 [Steroidobacteraceae bacterium]